MTDSILNSTKKILGIAENYTEFDQDIILHINSVFATLNQLGLGPDEGFEIEDEDAEWAEYLANDKNLNGVRTYVYLRVRLLFDPPTTSFALESMNKQVEQFEWRLNVYREGKVYPNDH